MDKIKFEGITTKRLNMKGQFANLIREVVQDEEKVEKILEKVCLQAMETNTKTGEERLFIDTVKLLHNVNNYCFHDFKSTLATPKMELMKNLQVFLINTIEGAYDD